MWQVRSEEDFACQVVIVEEASDVFTHAFSRPIVKYQVAGSPHNAPHKRTQSARGVEINALQAYIVLRQRSYDMAMR